MRPGNWVAVGLTTCASIATFVYMASKPHDRCGSVTAEILFAMTPAAIVALLSVTTIVAAVSWKHRVRGDAEPAPDD
jgi:heme/copper-type cytochrome/quinol oxidase subunit 2